MIYFINLYKDDDNDLPLPGGLYNTIEDAKADIEPADEYIATIPVCLRGVHIRCGDLVTFRLLGIEHIGEVDDVSDDGSMLRVFVPGAEPLWIDRKEASHSVL